MGRAPFAPCVDGFAFVNDWKFDDVEKQTLHDVLTAALPAVEAITWPVIGPIVEPAIALQLPFAGPFLPIVLYYEVKAINDAVVNAIAGAVEAKDYGLCGGMAFASLDYWLQGWVVPRGISGGDQPSRDTPEGTVLRDYLWARLLDSVLANGVTILSWMAILHIPFLGGAQWLRDRSKEQFQAVKARIDGLQQPVPLALIGTTLNPFDNHQVLCYGYDDPGDGTGTLLVYDNNSPDKEAHIGLDFRDSILTTPTDDTFSVLDSEHKQARGPLRGFFATAYTPASPPPAVVLAKGLTTDPSGCAEERKPVQATYTAQNVGYHQSPKLELKVVASDGVAGGETAPMPIEQGASRPVDAELSFVGPGVRSLAVMADLGVFDSLPIHKKLPPADPAERPSVKLNIVPHLIVRAEAAGATDPCGVAGAAGSVTRFSVDVSGVAAPAAGWQWSVDGATAASLSDPVLEVQMPAQAGVQVTVSVVVTFEDGCTSTGAMTLTTIGAEQAELIGFLCQLAHTAVFGNVFVPSQIIPDPVPDVAFARADLVAVGELSERLVQTVNRILQAGGPAGPGGSG
jgi:hypothetical protein